MRNKLLALLAGMAVSAAFVAAAELWMRDQEGGSTVVVVDPPGMKYAIALGHGGTRRGWVEGAVPDERPGQRVLCLGDSVTYGVKADPRQTWPAQLQGLLRAQVGRPSVHTYNFGVNGWDAEQVASLAESRLAAWRPDVVVWGTFSNDLQPTMMLYDKEGLRPIYVGTSVPESARVLPEAPSLYLVRRSALFRRLQGALYARVAAAGERAPASEEFYEEHLDRLIAWAEREDVPLVVVAIPPHVLAREDRCPESFDGEPNPCAVALSRHRQITAILETRGVAWADVLPSFQAAGVPDFHPAHARDPDHPTEAGHLVIAETALPLVQDALGLERVPPDELERRAEPVGDPEGAKRKPKAAGGGP